jgi:hypothetical protein
MTNTKDLRDRLNNHGGCTAPELVVMLDRLDFLERVLKPPVDGHFTMHISIGNYHIQTLFSRDQIPYVSSILQQSLESLLEEAGLKPL